MNKQLFQTLSKYPFVFESTFHDSAELKQNKTCIEKCKEKDCLKLQENGDHLNEYICSKGYNNILLVINELKFIVNGLIYKDNKVVPAGRKKVRSEWIIDKDSVLLFANKIEQIEKHIVNRVNETTEKNFSMFHDFKTSMSIFYNCTQDIISKLPGIDFEDKLKNSEKSYQDLYDALDLITHQLGMIDVVVNPSSISFGNKREMNIYKLFHKMMKLFEHISTKKKYIF